MYNWITLLYSTNEHNIVNHLYFNKIFFKKAWVSSLRKQNKKWTLGFPGGAVVENLPANAGDTGSSPGLGRSHMPRSN